jgi:hypothetical protein
LCFENILGGVKWLNVISVAKALILAITSAIQILKPNEFGSQISRKSNAWLMEPEKDCMSVRYA